jgi:hypothetical protein
MTQYSLYLADCPRRIQRGILQSLRRTASSRISPKRARRSKEILDEIRSRPAPTPKSEHAMPMVMPANTSAISPAADYLDQPAATSRRSPLRKILIGCSKLFHWIAAYGRQIQGRLSCRTPRRV